ncbi:MAG: hypothetical protein J6U73_07875 [Alistipes sp.]|nr:hypothetical protein [Alistipes sp.]
MADYNSKYTGEQVEAYLDQLNDLALGNYATKNDINTAIAEAITNVLNTEV